MWIVAMVVWASGASAQEHSGGTWFVRSGLTAPHILPASPFESKNEVVNWVPNLTLEIGRQTSGTKDWHHLYGLPSYGVGLSLAHFQSGARHGEPIEAYAFFSWPLFRITDRLDTTTDFGMGLSWNWQQVNPQTPQATQTVLGSDLNARIDWGFYLRYLASPRMSVYTGLDFTHRSNGGLVQPDLGINVLGPRVAVQYNFSPQPLGIPSAPSTPPPFRPSWEFSVGGAGGLKNVVLQRSSPLLREDFGVFHVNAAAHRQFYQYGKIGIGSDVMYDGATGVKRDFVDGVPQQLTADPRERFAVGVYGGYEHVIGRFGAFVDLGYIVARAADNDVSFPRFYQRFGWRFLFNERFWGTLAVRSIDGHKADSLEVGAGYRFVRR